MTPFTCGNNAAGNSQSAPCCGCGDSGSRHSVPAILTAAQQRTATPARTRPAYQALGLPVGGRGGRIETKSDSPNNQQTGTEA